MISTLCTTWYIQIPFCLVEWQIELCFPHHFPLQVLWGRCHSYTSGLASWTQTHTHLQNQGQAGLSTGVFMQSAQMLLHSGALTPTHCCCCCRLTLFPAASTGVSLQGSCNSGLHYFIIWVMVAGGSVSFCITFTTRTGTLPQCAGWRQLHRSWQMVFTTT